MMHIHKEERDNLLRQRGYRLTPQRHMILNIIQEADEHLSMEQIVTEVQKLNPQVSLSTVYRTLELLKELNLVRESRLGGEQAVYEAIEGHAHHHLVCRRCHTTVHLNKDLLGNLNEQLQQQYQFHDLHLELVAAGYCDACWHSIQQAQSSTEQE